MCHFVYRLVKLPTSNKQEYEHVDDQVLGGLGCSEFFLACVSFLKREELIKHSPRGQSESDIDLISILSGVSFMESIQMAVQQHFSVPNVHTRH